ncbi:hypothetical protein [Tropicibacter sp. S64]|uniref:hypothetical protein n=1 Tax=Tropicibacter sp. S64 TaxID=3415122 RepID=UPI003C7D31F3
MKWLSLIAVATLAAAPAQALVFGNGDVYSASFDLLDFDAGGGAQVLPDYTRIGAGVGFSASDALDTGEQAIVDVFYGSGLSVQYTFDGTAGGFLGGPQTSVVAPYTETTGLIRITAVGSFDLAVLDVIAKGTLEGGGTQVFAHSVFEALEIAAVPLPAGAGLLAMALAVLGWPRRRRRQSRTVPDRRI